MAKVKATRPQTKTVTLSTGTKVTGAAQVVDKLVARDGGKATPSTSSK